MSKARFMNRVLICLLGAMMIVAVFFAYLLFRPDVGTRIFFGTGPSSVEIKFKNDYEVPVADKKTEAIVAAARLLLDSLDE